jgi:hypothetical protein
VRLRGIFVAALLILSGCAAGSDRSAPATFAGPPAFPATVDPADQSTPLLPGTGPVGRGALTYRSPRASFATVLLLEDGRQFRLPATPLGEGRQGSLYATLSPDGRWLGRRVAAYPGDERYLVEELTGTRVVHTGGLPVLWSANGQFLVMAHDDDATSELTLVEPASGRSTSMHTGRFQDGLWLAGVLPDGRPLFANGPARSLRLRTGGHETTVVFAAGPEDECWCPHSLLHPSPDGRTVSVQLDYDNGVVPGTGEKTRPKPTGTAVIEVIDLSSGTVAHRFELTAPDPSDSWALLSDTGSGLLLERRSADGTWLVLVDPATGGQHPVTALPDAASITVPGQLEPPHDG